MSLSFTSYHVGVAAEALVAGQFARLGYDVSVQYGANQPEYDPMVVSGNQVLKVSVKGSQDGSWGLTQSHLTKGKADYHSAVDRWLAKHKQRTALCFVQFRQVSLDDLPRIYLATPQEVADRMRQSAKGRGDTILYEAKVWSARAVGAGTEDKVPASWRLSAERVTEVMEIVQPTLPTSSR